MAGIFTDNKVSSLTRGRVQMKMNMKKGAQASFLFIATAAIALGARPAQAELRFVGKVYEIDSNKEKQAFDYKQDVQSKDNGLTVVTNTYSQMDQAVAAVETTEFQKDGASEKLKSYRISQKQMGTEGVVELKDGRVHFSYTKDGKTKTADEKASDNVVVGPSLVPHMQKNWSSITQGKTTKVRMAVADRLETVGFEYFKEKDDTLNGEKVVVVKMKPSSFIIAALVNPMRFYFSPDGKRLVEFHGRTQGKKKSGNSWKDMDAVTVYEYVSGENSK